MSERRVTLDSAAFLDSVEAVRLGCLPTDGLRTVVQRFLTACYEDLGKAPRLLQGDELALVLRELLPRRFGVKDPLAPAVPGVLEAYLQFLDGAEVVSGMFELKSALAEHGDTFCAAVTAGTAHPEGGVIAGKGKTVQHRADKVGRNDPCPCGSGKKFKKCCARLGQG